MQERVLTHFCWLTTKTISPKPIAKQQKSKRLQRKKYSSKDKL